MKERLSRRETVFRKVFLTVSLFFIFSLPTPFGFFNWILIDVDGPSLVILQRTIHLGGLFYLIHRMLRNDFLLEFDSDHLFIVDHGNEMKIPIGKIYYLFKYIEQR